MLGRQLLKVSNYFDLLSFTKLTELSGNVSARFLRM